MSKEYQVVFTDGSKGTSGDFPVAVVSKQELHLPDGTGEVNEVVDPVFDNRVISNLYGRIMTLVEATTEPTRLKAVKDVFSKELMAWENDVYTSARDIALDGMASTPNNLYLRQR